MEQLQNYQESIHEVVSKEGLEYLHGVIVGVIEHSAREGIAVEGKHVVSRAVIKLQKALVTKEVSGQSPPLSNL